MKTYEFYEHSTTERKLKENDYQRKKVTLQALIYGACLVVLGIIGLICFTEQRSFTIIFSICIVLGALFPLLPYLISTSSRRQLRQYGVEPMDFHHTLDEQGLHYQTGLGDEQTLIPYSAIKRVEVYEDLLFFVPKKRDFQFVNVDLSALTGEEREQLLREIAELLSRERAKKAQKKQKKESDFWNK